MYTPWGFSDSKETLAKGITSYSTPSHGGIRLSPERIEQVPQSCIDANFLKSGEWWEEDCDWCVPYIIFADDIRAHGRAYKFEESLELAKDTARYHHPELVNKNRRNGK